MIYTGYYVPGLPLASDRLPQKCMCEKEMMEWAKDHWQELDGSWVNNTYLLVGVPAEMIVVVLWDGTSHALTTHPQWEKWKDEMKPDEFYSFLNLEHWQ
jgi:hypothetical protein